MAGHPGHVVSAAARAKISAALRGKKHPHKGHAISPTTRAKISAANKGKHRKGHAISAATRAKISASLKARHAGKTRPQSGHTARSGSGRAHPARKAGHVSTGQPRRAGRAHTTGHRTKAGHLTGVRRPHGNHRPAFGLISANAGYRHSYVGRLRAARKPRSSKPRHHVRRSHRVRPRRK